MTRANPNEGDVKKDVVKILHDDGWFVFRPAANQFGTTGVSDILALKRGTFLAIEAKLKKKEGSTHQEDFMQEVRDAGGYAVVVNQHRLQKLKALLAALNALPDRPCL